MRSASVVRSRRKVAAIVLATAALGLAACGDDDEESSTAASEETTTEEAAATDGVVEVVATEYAFDVTPDPSAETESFSITNEGKEFHVMIFAKINEGFTVEEAIEMEGEKGSAVEIATAEIPPGKTVEAEVKEEITPGEYAMLCPIGGPEGAHFELGQLNEYTIE